MPVTHRSGSAGGRSDEAAGLAAAALRLWFELAYLSAYRSRRVGVPSHQRGWRSTATDDMALGVPCMSAARGGARAARLRDRMGERDLAVLGDLARFRLLTTVQVQRLHIADGSELTRARRARALMHRLTSLHLVIRSPRRVGGIRAGSAGQAYGLSGLGEAVLGVSGPYGKRRRSMWTTKSDHHDHALGVSELYVRLVETVRTQSRTVELACFETEPACWRRFSGIGGESITLKPDAFVRTWIGEFALTSFVEFDRDTESLPTIRRKCECYVRYWRSGIEQQTNGVFPQVVWLVPSEKRRDGLRSVFQRLAHEAQSLFAVALHSEGANFLTTLPEIGGAR